MDITLLESVRIGGVEQASGTTLTVDDAFGADLVTRKAATNNSPFYGDVPVTASKTLTGVIEIDAGESMIVIADAAPDDNDGRPVGTLYFQRQP